MEIVLGIRHYIISFDRKIKGVNLWPFCEGIYQKLYWGEERETRRVTIYGKTIYGKFSSAIILACKFFEYRLCTLSSFWECNYNDFKHVKAKNEVH